MALGNQLSDLIAKGRPAPITTVGYLVYEDSDVILMVATIDEEHLLVSNPLYLLKTAVVNIKQL